MPSPTTTAPSVDTTPALDFDARLALAALAVDARIDTTPLDLADVITLPVEVPRPAPAPYRTPLATLLHRASVRLATDGWCPDRYRDEQGGRCLVAAIRVEATSRGEADDACALLLEAIQREFVDAETVPSWNGRQHGPRIPLRVLGWAADMADARGI